jgi:hypothetical protein
MTRVLVLTFVVAIVPSLLDAQSGCRSDCEAMLRQCQQSCADADDPARCNANCRVLHDQCVAGCES